MNLTKVKTKGIITFFFLTDAFIANFEQISHTSGE